MTTRLFFAFPFFENSLHRGLFAIELCETHFELFILAHCFCYWTGVVFAWPDLFGFGAWICTFSS